MFEQSLYNQEAFAPVPEAHEGDLFYNYEFKNWELSPRLYKILGLSVIANLLFLGITAQSDLTRKGCDTFLTSAVCQVIDTAYVANALFGTKRDYVDAVYEKTDLKNADITFVEVKDDNETPLQYPDGYFAIANPEQYAMMQNKPGDSSTGYIAPGLPIPNSNGGGTFMRPARPPKADPNAVVGNVPSSPLGDSTDDPTVAAVDSKNPKKFPGTKNGNGQANTSPNANQTAKNDPNALPNANSTKPVGEEDINKRPLKDFGSYVNDLRTANGVNLAAPFEVNAKGKLTKDGKLDPKSFKWVKATTTSKEDEKILEVVKQGIEAISDSGYLNYLKDLSGKNLDLTITQSDKDLNAVVQSEMESETRAKSITSALNFLISLKKGQKTSAAADQNDKDDLLLLNGATVVADGKKITITFNVPKDVVMPMITRKLDELAKEPKQGNDSIGANGNINTAVNR